MRYPTQQRDKLKELSAQESILDALFPLNQQQLAVNSVEVDL